MNFKRNLIIILVIINLLMLFFLLSKHEKFSNNRAAYIDPKLKNKVKIESSVLLDANRPDETGKKNSELYIDGNVTIGTNTLGNLPTLCFGSKCYSNKILEDFLKYNIPYEVFDTDPVEEKTPDKLCYDIEGMPPNCITGEDLKLLNGKQYIYIAGPKYDDLQSKNFKSQHHLQSNLGPAPHYYYDINNNYYENLGKKNKEASEKYDNPDCLPYSWQDLYNEINQGRYKNTGVDKVPYFFNLNVLNDVSNDIKQNIKVDNNTLYNQYKCSGVNGEGAMDDRCGDGILQMVKQPVHKKAGGDYDSSNAYQHRGNHGHCDNSSSQDNQIMNLAAVNLLPNDFKGDITDSELGVMDVRDRIRYKLVPGEKTGLRCS